MIPLYDKIVDWSQKRFQTSSPTGTHHANTYLDIQGSGYLVCIHRNGTNVAISLQIDGGAIYNISSGQDNTVNLFPIRFNTSLVIKTNTTVDGNNFAWVVLD
ncbi:hypothetical protein BHU72_12050 [Desulfuribacillus stibiiarsenatis]|uniref:Uncharacterized protein n=1 Tax=Desulfuribacillus stibiiarsenatis TaxID=1390249 RepID=A0A1E5L7Y8_9FIRM|nr:hypothetical protein [Desulfuribacillus stibiiarsenatis]OEH86260.1 hypothetical protein BHU72_12050 [Desulfuribacillus stibiiarsenatis]